jgi:hypothetical protein
VIPHGEELLHFSGIGFPKTGGGAAAFTSNWWMSVVRSSGRVAVQQPLQIGLLQNKGRRREACITKGNMQDISFKSVATAALYSMQQHAQLGGQCARMQSEAEQVQERVYREVRSRAKQVFGR